MCTGIGIFQRNPARHRCQATGCATWSGLAMASSTCPCSSRLLCAPVAASGVGVGNCPLLRGMGIVKNKNNPYHPNQVILNGQRDRRTSNRGVASLNSGALTPAQNHCNLRRYSNNLTVWISLPVYAFHWPIPSLLPILPCKLAGCPAAQLRWAGGWH